MHKLKQRLAAQTQRVEEMQQSAKQHRAIQESPRLKYLERRDMERQKLLAKEQQAKDEAIQRAAALEADVQALREALGKALTLVEQSGAKGPSKG